ncbi:hypothetical protein AGLY_003326 [Aphis glycines]|uniref:DNA-directed DNA polymerase n=1 Tax=Aphis glycines TaxID=307491 RepID=A0A6G0U045_APHGL|nr:hypothetical protein AGLY_003326 [Aphis glycines]
MWPAQPSVDEEIPEVRQIKLALVTTAQEEDTILNKFSEWLPLIRITAFILWFRNNSLSFKTQQSRHKEVALRFSIKFVDTFRFMASSLSELAENLLEDKSRFKETLKLFSNKTLDLVTRKGVFSYEYIDSWKTRLPSKSAFYNSLKDEKINNNNYSHAKKIWKVFNIKTLGDYSDLYLKTDVAILTDVFENFTDLCLSTLSLDPAHYMTTPGFAFNCMLKYTMVKLKRLTDYNMFLYFESSIRGGICQSNKRYAKANIPDIKGLNYNPDKSISWITCLDCVNLYGKSMLTELPFKEFEWVDDLNIDVTKIPHDSEVGYILEVRAGLGEDGSTRFNDEVHFVVCLLQRAPQYIRTCHGKQEIRL